MRLKQTAESLVLVATLLAFNGVTASQQASPSSTPPAQTQPAQPAIEEWVDDFDGDRLDETKWEPHIRGWRWRQG